MTARKRQVETLRPPSYVCRDTGAAELEISPDTWDALVKEGRLERPDKRVFRLT